MHPTATHRVARVDRNLVVFRSDEGHELAVSRAALRTQDWVTGDLAVADGSPPTTFEQCPRTTVLRRGKADGSAQPIVANIDLVLLAVPHNEAERPGILERLAVIGWDSGAVPVMIVTKSDLLDGDRRREVERCILRACPGVEWIFTSGETGEGVEEVRERLGANGVAVLIGHSGVGKSRLINALSDGRALPTGGVRPRDSKGRHTTTSRQLVPVDGTSSLIIDTPGVRELGVQATGDGVAEVYPEVEEFAAQCRFADCAHQRDAGCRVREAIAEGLLDAGRVRRYLALERELAEPPAAHLGRRDKTKEYTRFAREYRRARGHD